MLSATIEIIRAALRADSSVSAAERTELLARLRRGPNPVGDEQPVRGPAKLLRRNEAARRLGMTTRALDRLCQQGVLAKRKLPGRQRASGIVESDLNALIAGGETGGIGANSSARS